MDDHEIDRAAKSVALLASRRAENIVDGAAILAGAMMHYCSAAHIPVGNFIIMLQAIADDPTNVAVMEREKRRGDA